MGHEEGVNGIKRRRKKQRNEYYFIEVHMRNWGGEYKRGTCKYNLSRRGMLEMVSASTTWKSTCSGS